MNLAYELDCDNAYAYIHTCISFFLCPHKMSYTVAQANKLMINQLLAL